MIRLTDSPILVFVLTLCGMWLTTRLGASLLREVLPLKENVRDDGSKDIKDRALSQAKRLLSEYEEPKLDPAKDEELRDYIARRESIIPAVDALNDEY
jgi:hypothetical protein